MNDTRLQKLASHVGGFGAVLRIGGSDQNSMAYDLNRTDLPPPCACGHQCTLTLGVWRQIVAFARASGHRLLFGLAPDADMATALIRTAAARDDAVFAYTFGNEINSASLFDGYRQIRALLNNGTVFPVHAARPLLAGPDVALQRHASLEDALAGKDSTIVNALAWVESFAREVSGGKPWGGREYRHTGGSGAQTAGFVSAGHLRFLSSKIKWLNLQVGDTLDALSFHTYDFETAMLGGLRFGVRPRLSARLISLQVVRYGLFRHYSPPLIVPLRRRNT